LPEYAKKAPLPQGGSRNARWAIGWEARHQFILELVVVWVIRLNKGVGDKTQSFSFVTDPFNYLIMMSRVFFYCELET
jgi:hypothetical protein